MEDLYTAGPVFTLAVEDASVGFTAETLKPTSGEYEGLVMEKATFIAVGALYMETSGTASAASFPMAAGDIMSLTGYYNVKRLRFIKHTTNTTLVVIPFYR